MSSPSKPGLATLAVGAFLAAFGGPRSMAGSPEPAAPPTYDVVRVGDGQLSCTALAGEINELTREAGAGRIAAQAQAERAARSAQASAENGAVARRAALGGLLHASAFIPFGGGMAAYAVRSAAMNAAGAAANTPQVLVQAPAVAAAYETPQTQRLSGLQAIFQRKSC